jgi:ParB/RepB/Spo0J family partition protein
MTPEFRKLAVDSVYISPYNVRQDPGDLTELMASIRDVGVLEPILVRQMGEQYQVIAGRRRLEAARRLELQTIPASVLDEVTDLQAIIISLIENIQRKDLTLAERVQTYQTLQQLDPDYRSQRSLAKAIGVSHRKISEDFQVYEMALKLQPYGIRVESDFPLSAPERQQGLVLPEYHAVLLHQAMAALVEQGAIPAEAFDETLVKVAKLIAPLSQDTAKLALEAVKAGESLERLFRQYAHSKHFKAGPKGSSRRGKSAAKPAGKDAGPITCSCCDRILQLVCEADGTHAVTDTPFSGHPVLPDPEFPDEPFAAALPPTPVELARLSSADVAPALEALETPQPILKRISGYTLDKFPRGLDAVLTPQTSGFWGKLTDSPARPDFSETEMPQSIWTADPWVGCLWGLSCRFCYVPSVGTRLYEGGQQSYWYQEWGNWLLYKPDFTSRLRKHLLDGTGQTRPLYQGAAIYYSPKTDPLLPVTDALTISARNLDVFLDADIFLMLQTRSKAVERQKEPDILNRIIELARRKKVGVSFSISTDLLTEQRKIETGGLAPAERLRIMARLKASGVFVSAAVAPLMPYSPEFAHKLVECCHHASIQVLHQTGSGAATPKVVLTQTQREIPHYRELERNLAEDIDAVKGAADFSWGIANKGFIGAFLAARRFYEQR